MLLCDSRGYCWCKIQSEVFISCRAWMFFCSSYILVIGTADMVFHSHLWVTASSLSHPFMDFLSSFLDNPLIKYECFLIIFIITKSSSEMHLLFFLQCFGKTVPSLFSVEALIMLDSFPENLSCGDKVQKRTLMVWGLRCNYSISFVGQH